MQSEFNVWDASNPDEHDAWLKLWQQWPEREVSSHPDYGNLFKQEGDRVLCATYASPNGSVLYAFISREIPRLVPDQGVLRDITTPYGYGGPSVWDLSDAQTLATEFWPRFDAWAKANDVVSEFIRFGLFPEMHLPYPGEIVSRSKNIVRSLDLDDEAMFKSFEQKVRKNVRKAERSGVTTTIDCTGLYLDDFMRIYEGTMDRRNAGSSYYFSRQFFEAIHHSLPGQFVYVHARHNDKIISTELALVSERSVYSFLGGTDREAFDLRPNDFLKSELIRWARLNEKQYFVLGGGATPADGIERYKRSFAPNGAVDFLTGQRILRPDVYEQLAQAGQPRLDVNDALKPSKSDFFPAYRSVR